MHNANPTMLGPEQCTTMHNNAHLKHKGLELLGMLPHVLSRLLAQQKEVEVPLPRFLCLCRRGGLLHALRQPLQLVLCSRGPGAAGRAAGWAGKRRAGNLRSSW